jgi:hypothetical protein
MEGVNLSMIYLMYYKTFVNAAMYAQHNNNNNNRKELGT